MVLHALLESLTEVLKCSFTETLVLPLVELFEEHVVVFVELLMFTCLVECNVLVLSVSACVLVLVELLVFALRLPVLVVCVEEQHVVLFVVSGCVSCVEAWREQQVL